MDNDIVLQCKSVCQEFNGNKILHDIDLTVVRGEFIGLVGPSGCGKSTLLKAILGTDPPFSGEILVDGKEVNGPNKDIGVVYQKYGLYDFLTVEGNVVFGLAQSNTSPLFRTFKLLSFLKMLREYRKTAKDILTKVKLESSIYKYPCELSGGMQQRVAIAQALVMRPKILLLDEPFGALDEQTRAELQQMLLVLYQENIQALKQGEKPPHTVILVTHELNEAFYCCDRVIGLSRNWRDVIDGQELTGKELGATKIFDKAGPTYHPEDPRNFDRFAGLISDLRRVVFGSRIQDRYENVTFWEDLQAGVGTGVALEWSERYDANGVVEG